MTTHPLLTQAALDAPDYVLIDTPNALADWIPRLAQSDTALGIDTETNGDNPRQHQVCLIQLGVVGLPIGLIDIRHMTLADLQPLAALLQQPRLKLFQNGKFDLKMLTAMGLPVRGPYFDTLLASRVLRGGQADAHGLGDLVQFYLKLTMDKGEQTSFLTLGDDPLTPSQCRYAARDVTVLHPLWAVQVTALRQRQRDQVIAALESQLLPVLVGMELRGFDIDTAALQRLTQQTAVLLEDAKQTVLRHLCPDADRPLSLFGGQSSSRALNLNSAAAVRDALEAIGLDGEDTPKALLKQAHKHPAVKALLDYRYRVRQQTWLKKLRDGVTDGRVYVTYNQCPRQHGRLEHSFKWEQWPQPLDILTLCQPIPRTSLLWFDCRRLPLQLLAHAADDERFGPHVGHLEAATLEYSIAMGCGVYGYRAASLQQWLWEQGHTVILAAATRYANDFFKTYAGVTRYHQMVKASDFYKPTVMGRYRRLEVPGQRPALSDRLSQIVLTGASDGLKQVLVALPDSVTPLLASASGLLVACPPALRSECQAVVQTSLHQLCPLATVRCHEHHPAPTG